MNLGRAPSKTPKRGLRKKDSAGKGACWEGETATALWCRVGVKRGGRVVEIDEAGVLGGEDYPAIDVGGALGELTTNEAGIGGGCVVVGSGEVA